MEYKEGVVNGAAWNRFNSIQIENRRNAIPVVVCREETVIQLDTGTITKPSGYLVFNFDPSAVIPLLNPTTNEPTGGNITGAEVYQAVYSYVLSEALKRDSIGT